MKRTKMRLFYCVLCSAVMLGFQNCGKASFTEVSGQSANSSTTASGNGSGGSGTPGSSGSGGTAVSIAIQTASPVLAVRGVNCMVCHGIVNGTVVTDFGYGSANFITSQSFWKGTRSAYNAEADGDPGGSWESLSMANGILIVPKISISAQVASTMFGMSTIPTSFVDVFSLANPAGYGSLEQGIVPMTGQAAVTAYSSISIKYPSQSEILALMPSSLQASARGVAVIANVAGVSATPSISGIIPDPGGGSFMRNSGTVGCYGDIVVKGPLFLNNLQLQTDANGCRLYVSQTVFIQGPITYLGAAAVSATLQITSPTAISMGMSAQQMGAAALNTGPSGTTPAAPSTNRTSDNVLTTPGGPWPRFIIGDDSQFNPGLQPINGVAPTAFFDGIVADALAIGPVLQDAGDPAAVTAAASIPGESVVDQTDGYNPGNRVAINYSGLLLNAPHVHSRYIGSLKGVIVAEVAMLARNPVSGTSLEQFNYDQRFNNTTLVLPALTTTILQMTP